MRSEMPLPSRYLSADALDKPTPPTPVPELPRLSILDLLVWMTCVVVYMGLAYLLEDWSILLPESAPPLRVAKGVFYGIGWGTALAGVVLMMARNYRRFPFPLFPGEYLLVLMGLDIAIRLAISLVLPVFSLFWKPVSEAVAFFAALQCLAALGLYTWVFVWAVTRVRIRRWRVALLAIPGSYAVWLLLLSGGFDHWALTPHFPRCLIAIIVTAVALIDLVDRRRYPWTHWLGVGTRLWLDASAVGYAAWRAFASALGSP